MKKSFPVVCIALALITVIVSSAVAMTVRGMPWRTVPVLQLRHYGGVDTTQLVAGEWWRLLSAQFIHVQPAHMVFNVVALLAIGIVVEQAIGSLSFLLLWLLTGVAGTLASIYHVPPPYDVGSGGSQALMGIAAAGLVVIWRNNTDSDWRWRGAVILTLLIQLALDLASAHRLQPGHAVGFIVGFALAIGVVRKRISPRAARP